MKIFIKNYSVQEMADLVKQRSLKKYHIRSFSFIRILSEEGLFTITPNKLIRHVCQSDCHEIVLHNQWVLWLDKSEIQTHVTYQVPFNHLNFKVMCHYYSVNKNKDGHLIQLVVEETHNISSGKYVVSDFYFEVSKNLSESEIINNADLNVFLSLLN
jgi:hypothetical protein